MRFAIILALLIGAPAMASPEQDAAMAYCAARKAGLSDKASIDRAYMLLQPVNSDNRSFVVQRVAVSMIQNCPEYFMEP